MINKKITICLVEDSKIDIDIINDLLNGSDIEYKFLYAKDADTFTELMKSMAYKDIDVIICDYYLKNGSSALDILKLYNDYLLGDIPFIVISSMATPQMAVNIMRLGAATFLFKDDLYKLEEEIKKWLSAYEAKKIKIYELITSISHHIHTN